MAQRIPLVGLRGELGDTVSWWHRGAIKEERWVGKGHFPGCGGGAWSDRSGRRK